MSARKHRRAVERARLDRLAAESYQGREYGADDQWASVTVDDFLAGVAFERQRRAIHWRREAPDWLKLAAFIVVGLCATAACWLFVLVLAWATP